ncbi:MAG TPA: plastocyanin/azurin family copper-binding protein [bacterium]|nr:plastocyanin/azurin family copper-binding protein [bacterium]
MTGTLVRVPRDVLKVSAAVLVLATAMIAGVRVGPRAAAAANAPKAYVGLYGDDAIGVLDTATGRLVRTIKVPDGPEAVIVAPGGQRVYVSSEDATSVSVIDTGTDTVVKKLQLGEFPEGMALSRDGRTLLAAVFGTDRVDVIDTATLTVAAQIPVAKAHGVTLAPDGQTAYIGSQDVPDHNAIVVLDVPGRRVAATVPLEQTPRGLFISPDAKFLYFTTANSGDVYILDRATNKVTGQITVGPIPHQMAFTPDHKKALVVVQGTGQLAVVDLASAQVVKDVPVGKYPHWVGLTSDGALAYVTNEGDDTVSVVDVAAERVVATLRVGSEPRKISLQQGPAAMTAYTSSLPAGAAEGFAAHPLRPAPAAAAGNVQIHIRAFAFGAQTVTLAAGHAVTWINDDVVPHTATAQTDHGKLWDTGQVVPGSSMTVTLSKPGTYVYQCDDHPFMRAKLIVTR